MPDSPTRPHTVDDAGLRPECTSIPAYPGTPRWVTVFGIVALVLVLLVVIALFVGGNHGPARHVPSGGTGGDTPPIGRGVRRP